jgi:hypothetical protein
MKKSVLQDWVVNLPGLRHQGVLLTVVRGCDTAPKEDASKALTRCLRDAFLNAFVGDAAKAKTFIERVDGAELSRRQAEFLWSLDQYPLHYVTHVIHAAEIVGYFHPDDDLRLMWNIFYVKACRKLHLYPESMNQLNDRLLAEEERFAEAQ